MNTTDVSINEQRIRELAYQIWETEGRPEGQAARHWELAYKLAEVEARPEPAPTTRSRRARKPQEAEVVAPSISVSPAVARKTRAVKTSTAKLE